MAKICPVCGESFPNTAQFCGRDGSPLTSPTQSQDELIGRTFCDRYVVTSMLGSGGMASVYLADDSRLPQQVAIKVLRDRTADDATLLARFRQEAEAASRINHDRVARVTDFGSLEDGRAFIIMEYVKGKTLKDVLEKRGALSPAEAARITLMVAEGLDAAHRLGIVHRDLKPENVMVVDDAGGGTRVKVLDFGIAKVLHDDEEGHTKPGFVIGTPQWMSPEQLLGEPLDARSDVYTLGLLAITMLTGQRAFKGETPQVEMLARLSTAPRTLGEMAPQVKWPPGLQSLLNSALAREAGKRPEGALAFARDFSRLIEHNAQQETPAYAAPAVPGVRRAAPARNFVIAGGVVVLALATAYAVREMRRSNKTSSVVANSAIDSGTTTGGSPVGASLPDAVVVPPTTGGTTPQPKAAANADSVGRSTGGNGRSGALPPKTGRTGGADAPVAGGVTNAGAAPAADARGGTSQPTTSPHDELQRIMDDADGDIGKPVDDALRTKAREIIRRLDLLSARLSDATDRGWANFYIGTAHATLGERDKACAALDRAHGLAAQSRALRTDSEHLQQTLSCQQ